jgi:hypothetical protein
MEAPSLNTTGHLYDCLVWKIINENPIKMLFQRSKYLQFKNNATVKIHIKCKLSMSGLESSISIDPNQTILIRCTDRREYGIVDIGFSNRQADITGLRVANGVNISSITHRYICIQKDCSTCQLLYNILLASTSHTASGLEIYPWTLQFRRHFPDKYKFTILCGCVLDNGLSERVTSASTHEENRDSGSIS